MTPCEESRRVENSVSSHLWLPSSAQAVVAMRECEECDPFFDGANKIPPIEGFHAILFSFTFWFPCERVRVRACPMMSKNYCVRFKDHITNNFRSVANISNVIDSTRTLPLGYTYEFFSEKTRKKNKHGSDMFWFVM